MEFDEFQKKFLETLEPHDFLKKKLRVNLAIFIYTELRKTIMKRDMIY